MFSSPNDYSNYYSNSANWLRTSGITAMNKHFAYLSLLDEIVPFNNQLTNLQGLGLYPLYDTTFVDISSSPYSNSHCLYTTQTPGLAILYHNSTMKLSSINNSVWTYMLTSDPSEGCSADLDGDLIVGVGDVLTLLGEFGCSSGCTADLDADGNVTISDVLNLLGLFGESCP